MTDALDAWRAIVLARQMQMDAAYAGLRRTSGDFWDRRATRFRALGRRLPEDDLGLRLLRRLTDGDSTVLDVGAGAGRYACAIAPYVRHVVAVEPNAALAGHLRTDAAEAGIHNIEVVEARWEEATVEAADLVLCSHVLYPHPEVGPFIGKLDAQARRACLILAMASWQEPPLLLNLWQRFHGEPRRGQPDARHVIAALYELGIPPNVAVDSLTGGTSAWTFASLEEAVAVCREHLILSPDDAVKRDLATALTTTLAPTDDGLVLPSPPRVVAGIWWMADGPRLAASPRDSAAERVAECR